MLSKAVLRQAFRTNLDRAETVPSDELNKRLTEFLRTQTGVWAGFEPLGFEADVRPAIEQASHLKWAFPRIEHDTLKFYAVRGREELVQNHYGIWEPDPTRARHVHHDEFHGMLIPGLAFDESGNRLGRGKGFYDRALAEILQTNQPLKVGVALERQIARQELPRDAHDVAMDLVITESRNYGSPKWAAKGTLP